MRIIILFFYCIVACFLHGEQLVDIVYTWVDGSDQTWQEQKKFYLNLENPDFLPFDSYIASRFNDRDELKYSLRSIWQFAPWIHHVYIVTAGQRPTWLKDHPYITIVGHKEIFKDLGFLPTFNSHAIEANLHHIPNLEEEYLYFNDDVFFGHPNEKEDFFTDDERPKISFHEVMPFGSLTKKDGSWLVANKNATKLLSILYKEETWPRPSHTLMPLKKSTVFAIEAQIPEIFHQVSSHRFRSILDYAMTNGLIPHMAIRRGEAINQRTNFEFLECGMFPEKDEKALLQLLKKQPLSFCIQDKGDNPLSLQYLKEFYEEYFPLPAPWEKEESD
jgi:hypothetical protein